MAVYVKIPTPLQKLTGGVAEIEGTGNTVLEVLAHLDGSYPGLLERLTEDGNLRRFVLVFVNGEDVRFGDGAATSVVDGDELSIVPAIAGGAWKGR